MADPGLSLRLKATAPIALDIALDCAPGELLAIIGPSGAGKSTTLRAIAGLHHPESGHVICDGEAWLDTSRALDLPAHRRRVGLVFQDYALFPHMTALANVMAAMGHVHAAERAPRAAALLARVHLAGLEQRRPAELSGGQQQRVAVARALARDPAVLLLDEPFSAVDRATRRRLQVELANLRQGLSIPIILVTHDLDEAASLADRMLLLHRGRGLQTAPPAEMEAAPMPSLPPGTAVDWLIGAGGVVLHRRGRPSAGERENPVSGTIIALLPMGEEMRVTLDVGDPEGRQLTFALPRHAAQRNGLAPGEACSVSLLRDALHVMPRP
jgi:molybdate transport system ATP-binding protein